MVSRHHSRRAFVGRSTLVSGAALAGLHGLGARASLAQSTPGAASATPLSAENREGEFLERDGARIFYQVTGEGDPILLLHGYPLSGSLFDRNRDALAESYQVITVDHRGYGESETDEVPDSIAIYAEDALAVLD
ncbi:MAG: alpha/beta hydrolase [Chloroflexia bacterium]|nr:alpha/beta hydrolase [Chloroflexia bacterium]